MNRVIEGLKDKSKVKDLEVPLSLKLEAENGLESCWIKRKKERRMIKKDVSWRAVNFVPKCQEQ